MYTFWNNGKHACVDNGVKIATNDGRCYVAISAKQMGANKEKCGKIIYVGYSGKILEAIVSDICGDCADFDIDLSQPAYEALTGDNGGGKQSVYWRFAQGR